MSLKKRKTWTNDGQKRIQEKFYQFKFSSVTMLLKQEIRNFLHFSFGEKKNQQENKENKNESAPQQQSYVAKQKVDFAISNAPFLFIFICSVYRVLFTVIWIMEFCQLETAIFPILLLVPVILLLLFLYIMLKYTGLVKLQLAMKFKLHAHFLFRYQLNKIRKTTKC